MSPSRGLSNPPIEWILLLFSRLLEKTEETVQSRVDDLEEWIRSKIPEPINKKKRVVSQKFKQLKKKVGQAFNIKIPPKEYKSFRKGYLLTITAYPSFKKINGWGQQGKKKTNLQDCEWLVKRNVWIS